MGGEMQVDLTGRRALITGGSSGLGLAMAQRFVASGADVAILARGSAALEAAAEGLRATGPGRVLALVADVTDHAQSRAAADKAVALWGGIDILVNNAGSSARGPIEALTPERLTQDLDLKLMSALALTRHLVGQMKARRWGRILNTSAIVAKAPGAESMPTSLSRAAGLAMTRALALELAPWNILVNALCVGKIKSGQWERRHAAEGHGQDYDTFLHPVAETIPLKRLGEAAEFANVACFLASDLASYVTGATLNVDGGLSPVA